MQIVYVCLIATCTTLAPLTLTLALALPLAPLTTPATRAPAATTSTPIRLSIGWMVACRLMDAQLLAHLSTLTVWCVRVLHIVCLSVAKAVC